MPVYIAAISIGAAGLCALGAVLLARRMGGNALAPYLDSLKEAAAETERLRQENNRHTYDLIVLYQFINDLAGCRSTSAVYQEFIETVQHSIEPEASCFFLFDPKDGGYHLAAQRGFSDSSVAGLRFAPGEGLIGWVAAGGSEILLEDAAADGRFPELLRAPFHPRFHTAACVPLLFQYKAMGAIAVGRTGEPFSQDDLRLLFIIANEAALYLRVLGLYEEVAELAITDGSTGLYNHRHFFEQIDLQLTEARAHGFRLSLLMLDIDDFKLFNDQHGHLAGDAVLYGVARVLEENTDPDHLAARYGGEEFAVLMPDTDIETACRVAETIRKKIAERRFVLPDRSLANVTVSIGVATYPDHVKDTANPVTDLIAAADEQLVNRAKSGRKNRVCCPERHEAIKRTPP